MGFYGNITNTSNTTFQFDKIYPNKATMEANINSDGIFIGRYVLVEYDKQADYPIIYEKNGKFYPSNPGVGEIDQSFQIKYLGEKTDLNQKSTSSEFYKNDIGQIQIEKKENGKIRYECKFYKCTGGTIGEPAAFEFIVTTSSNTPYLINYSIDEEEFGDTFDSTVWVKSYTDSGFKYVRIAELNSVVPTFNLIVDKPTSVPLNPHFDKDGTNINYNMHVQPQWGFRVAAADEKYSDEDTQWIKYEYDSAEDKDRIQYAIGLNDDHTPIWGQDESATLPAAIYYNKKAFKPKGDENGVITRRDNKTQDSINLTLGKSGKKYNIHNGIEQGYATSVQDDTQELTINLPAIGNMMSDAWDIIHGSDRDDYRGDNIYENNELIKTGSLQGRLDSFEAFYNNQIPIKVENGTIVGTKINGDYSYDDNSWDDKPLEVLYDKTTPTFERDDAWIETKVDASRLKTGDKNSTTDQFYNSGISIHHTFHPTTDTIAELNKNTGEQNLIHIDGTEVSDDKKEKIPVLNQCGNSIKLYTPYVDPKGHVVGKNIETIELPYSYRTITTNGMGSSTEPNTTDIVALKTENIVADQTQDSLAINSGNEWIRIDTDAPNGTIVFSHDIHNIETKHAQDIDLNNRPLRSDYLTELEYLAALSEWKKSTNGDTIYIPDWNYDEAGHIKEKRNRCYTLPFGYKTINVSNNDTENAAPIETEKAGETADNTQDVLQFSATNKWIKMQATGNDNIEFGHELSGIEAKEHKSSDINITNFGDSFNILKFTTDKAGHITNVGEDTIKIPSIIFTDDTTGNVVTNMVYNYNNSNKTGTFTETKENIGTLALGTHTGTTITTNGLNILSSDTISNAFNKTQTHINSLNLNSANSDLEWVTDVSQANGQVTIAKKGTDNLKLNNYSALTSVSAIDLASQDTLNNAFGKLEYRIKEEEKNRAAAIEALDVPDTIDNTKYVSGVSETNGKITVSRAGTDTLKLNNYTIANTSSDIINGDTINEAFGKVQKQIKDIYGSEEIAINFNTIKEIADWLVANDSNADKIIDDIATLKGSSETSGSVAHSIKTAIEGLDSEIEVEDTYNYLSGIAIENGKLKAIAQGTLGSAAFTESSDYALAGSYDDRVKEEDYLKKIAELEQENYTLNSRCNVLDKEVKNLINRLNELENKIIS